MATERRRYTREEALRIAQEIEHEARFTCEIINIGPARKPNYSINVTDKYTQVETRPNHWETLSFGLRPDREDWLQARRNLKPRGGFV